MTSRELIIHEVKSTKGTMGCAGILMVLVGLPLAVLIAVEAKLPEELGSFLLGQGLVLAFWLPGVFMVRSWLRKPERHPLVVAIDNPDTICLLDLQWISINNGATRGRIRLGTTAGFDDYVDIHQNNARAVFGWLQSIAPRATIGATTENLATLRSNPTALLR